MDGLYATLQDDEKRKAYGRQLLLEELGDDLFLENCHYFRWALNSVDNTLKLHRNPFLMGWDCIPEQIKNTADLYRQNIAQMREDMKRILGEDPLEDNSTALNDNAEIHPVR